MKRQEVIFSEEGTCQRVKAGVPRRLNADLSRAHGRAITEQEPAPDVTLR